MRAVDIWGIVWIFILLTIFYAVIYYDVVFEKVVNLFRRGSKKERKN